MICQFKHVGSNIDYTPGIDVEAGTPVVQGQLFGITNCDIPSNALGIGALSLTGVWIMPKEVGVGTALTVGTVVYWDVADVVVTADDDSGANILVGEVVVAGEDDDETLWVRLSR